MLRVAFFFLMSLALSTCYPYNSYCQNWCYGGHQSFVEPQLCSSYCGGYSGNYGSSSSCCSGGSQYPVVYSGTPIGPISWPGYGYGYGYGYGQVPTNQGPYIYYDPNVPFAPPTSEPARVTNPGNPQKPKEWVCPVDPSQRVAVYPPLNVPQGPAHCQYDENCPNVPQRQKCCFDSAIGAKVCKPAILV